ncbi:hypothetical protein K7640_28600 [Micromonospora sp. PLK6-60]|uniref:hypothetical protein n=1 Tax=Micromonospora sp. PLK6-60 TaxID=2873383 RepID=UPI001CA6B2C6|nr:hypothetical protein [Micromonospora sp. PLK6-60]MBY8875793.1 hypothetical protein [Micromonospora sp. PLK6-60]
MAAPRDRAGDPSAERRTLRGRLSRHYHQQLDGSGRGAVLGALIGLVAALIAAGATVYGVVGQHDDSGPPASPPAAGPVETSPAISPATPTTSPSTDPPSADPPSADPSSTGAASADPTGTPAVDDVQWNAEVRFDDDGIDLDRVPPTVQMNWPVFDSDLERISAAEDGKLHAENGYLALWPGPGLPSRQQCLERLATHGDEWMRIPRGQTGCLRTSKERIARITIVRYPDDSFQVTAKATVWSAQEES